MQKLKVQFAPGCFDDFDGTQEELDALIQEIYDLAESGELFDMATPISDDEMAAMGEYYTSRQILS
jgi:hypothetical protein